MKVNDYVRTKYGISKILKLEDINTSDNIYITKIIKIGDGRFITDDDIIKSSPNIIDLIQVGDYVNGNKVVDINGIIYVKDVGFLEEIEIKSIVTCEMFESMEYKVKE